MGSTIVKSTQVIQNSPVWYGNDFWRGVCLHLLAYFKNRYAPRGYTYRSEAFLMDSRRKKDKSELWLCADKLCNDFRGKTLEECFVGVDSEWLTCGFVQAAKGNYGKLRDDKPLMDERDLLGWGTGVVYAVCVTTQGTKYIKIGFTQTDLETYIARTYKDENPKLIAQEMGTRQLETDMKKHLSHHVGLRLERFFPSSFVVEYVRTTLKPLPCFDERLKDYFGK